MTHDGVVAVHKRFAPNMFKQFLAGHHIPPVNGTYEAYQAGATTMSATLYNMDGKVITSNNCNGNTISINTSNANKGIYLLKVSTGKFSHTQKIVIR